MVANSHPDRWRIIVRRRIIVAASVMALWGVAIEARLVHLQVLRYDELVERAVRQRSRTIETHPKRGEILDREGRVLAYSVDADTVVAFPSKIADPVDIVRQLCLILYCSEERRELIETRLGSDKLFAYVQRHVSVDAAKRIRELELPGIGLIKENRRFYPNKELAAHLIGYVGVDNQGLHGLESQHDKAIGGQPGKVLVQTDARNRAFSRVERPPTTGVTLELTIDKYIQHIAERELRRAVLEHDAAGGSVVVMAPNTGDILALANEPTFNPNAFSASTADLRRNRATQDVYEPGSTFKIVTASAALEEGVFHPDQVIDVSPGVVYFGGRPIRDIGQYGQLTFADVIVKSSNVGASKIGVALGAERLGRYVRRFGFGETYARDFPGQSRGIVHDPSTLREGALARVSMGYNISVTPLQMATAMNVVANGGELIAPRLVRAQLSGDGRQEVPIRVIRRAISERTASTLTRIMEDVVNRGTARRARVPGYTVAGKTGTSEKILPGGGYSETDHVASFGGFVPSTRPELTILVVVDDVARFGGSVAAPVFQRIAEAVLRHRGTLHNVDAPSPILVGEPDVAEPAMRTIAVSARMSQSVSSTGAGEGWMPDLIGMSARTALQTATELGLTTQISGRGFVVEQWPAADELVVEGQAVTLRLERFSTNGSRSGS